MSNDVRDKSATEPVKHTGDLVRVLTVDDQAVFRRVADDVTDIALRVVAGKLRGDPNGNLLLGDGVNFNIGAEGSNLTANGIYTVFPYLPTPHDGRNRRHVDCGEAAANPCN